MAYRDSGGMATQQSTPNVAMKGKAVQQITDTKPLLSKTKGVKFKSGAESDKIYKVSKEVSTTGAMPIPKVLRITNSGATPVVIMSGYETFSNTGVSAGAVKYLHALVLPGENIMLPVRAGISEHTTGHLLDGTLVDNTKPSSTMKTAITSFLDGGVNASVSTLTLDDNEGSPAAAVGFFRVGDKIRVDDEIMEVLTISANTGTEATITVRRGVDSSTAASHSTNVQVHLPYHNSYQKFDKYSSPQTDSLGKFKAHNMFGLARVNGVAVGTLQGITPGSFSLKFYTEGGWQSLGMSGITAGTKTGLVANQEYRLNITVDGGSEFSDLTFTTDASNLRFGGKNGLIEKIQEALDTQFSTAGSNLFERGVNVGIVEGDLRFTSATNKSTSAIALANASGGTNFFGVGRIPAVTNVQTEPARVPDDIVYDNVTYTENPNTTAFAYDDGKGNIFGAARGKISYETGFVDFVGPVEAEFEFSVILSGAFSGKLDSEDTHKNSLVDVYANTNTQKFTGQEEVAGW